MSDQFPQNNPHKDAPIGHRPDNALPPQGDMGQPVAQPRRPTRLTTVTARRRREKRNETFEFELPNTLDDDGNPTSALVRKPNIFDIDELNDLPDYLQQDVFELIELTEQAEGRGEGAADETILSLAQQFGTAASLADACCLRGFVDPRCYATAEVADANGGVWVKDIDATDRMSFFTFSTGGQQEAAKEVAGFRPEPVVAVQPRPAGDAVSEAGQPEQHPAAGEAIPATGHDAG